MIMLLRRGALATPIANVWAPAPAQAGVNAVRQLSLFRGFRQHGDEARVFAGAQAGEDFFFEFVDGGVGPLQDGVRPVREVELVGAAVRRVTVTPCEAAFFEFVDQPDHDIAVHAHRVGELLLAQPLVTGEVHQHAVMRGLQSQRRQHFGATGSNVKTKLGQQEDPAAAQRRDGVIFGHSAIVCHRYSHV
jgi:hypothetical protein